MMRALVDNHRNDEALMLYDRYHAMNDDVSYILALRACINIDDMEKGKVIHSGIDRKYYSIKMKSTLIDFYGHFGDISTAINIFDTIDDEQRDNVSINGMMTQFIKNGLNQQCLELHEKYKYLNDDISHLLALKAWTNLDDFEICKEIEPKLKHNMVGRTALIDFYSHFGDIEGALNVFNAMPINSKCIESVNAMITGYIKNECYESALNLYEEYTLMIYHIYWHSKLVLI